jgi:hypothetical protein
MITDLQIQAAAKNYRRDLGDGLVLRWSTIEDTEKVAGLCGFAFRDKENGPLNERIMLFIRQLLRGDHPVMGSGDFGLVEDTSKEGSPVVACACLQRMEWQYEGIRFTIGRPEFVASDPTYRNRGLIRQIFEMMHARSEFEGHLAQGITGIPYFYRQFGYEYALNLGGRRTVYLSLISKAKEGEPEAYTLRDATLADIPQMLECYNSEREASIVWTTLTEESLRYRITEWEKLRPEGKHLPAQIMTDTIGKIHGFAFVGEKRWGRELNVWGLFFAPGSNLLALKPSLLRALEAYGQQVPLDKEDLEPFSEIQFNMGAASPFYQVLGEGQASAYDPPYAWYVRVPDLPAFIKHIAPALEKRLMDSPVAGYTGDLNLTFYRGGLRLVFENGHLTSAEPWRAPLYNSDPAGSAKAGFPPLVFLQLLFGRKSLKQLREFLPDVWATDEAAVLLDTLFPARPSYVVEV